MTETMTSAEYHALTSKRNKYNARRVCIDGYSFDSQAEARRYVWLRDEQQEKRISGLRVHPTFELQPKFTDGSGKKHRAIYYKADFSYVNTKTGRQTVEDVKGGKNGAGTRTQSFNMKMKMFLYRYREVSFFIVDDA
jgi:hypothetical protein